MKMRNAQMAMVLTTVIGCAVWSTSISQAGMQGGAMGDTTNSSTNTVSPTNTVTVTGIGSITFRATAAQITVQVPLNDTTIRDVLNDNRKYEQSARNALSRLKIPSGDVLMFTSGLNVGNGPNGSLYITITMPNGPKVEQVEDTMLSIWGTGPTAPMNVSVNVQYLPQNLKAARANVFSAALADAKAQADQLANDVGMKTGKVVSMQTSLANGGYTMGPYGTNQGLTLGGLQTAYQYPSPGDMVTITSQITVTYQLTP